MKPDPAGATSDVISLREYVEAKIEGERELNRVFRGATAEEFRVFKETLAKEVAAAADSIAKELVHLNELRKEVTTDRGLFVRDDKYAVDLKARDAKVDAIGAAAAIKTEGLERLLGARLDILEKWQAQMQSVDLKTEVGTHETRLKGLEAWRNKLLGIGLMVGLVSGLVGALLMRLLAGVFGGGGP